MSAHNKRTGNAPRSHVAAGLASRVRGVLGVVLFVAGGSDQRRFVRLALAGGRECTANCGADCHECLVSRHTPAGHDAIAAELLACTLGARRRPELLHEIPPDPCRCGCDGARHKVPA